MLFFLYYFDIHNIYFCSFLFYIRDLSSNKIRCVNNRTFSGLTGLYSLRLDKNAIGCIEPSTFDQLPDLTNVELNGNPFHCNCHLIGLRSFLKDTGMGGAVCSSPQNLANRRLDLLKELDFKCPKDSNEVGCHGGVPPCCAPDGRLAERIVCDKKASCPEKCTCTRSVVRCSSAGLKQIPSDIPSDTTELYVDHNNIQEIRPDVISSLPKHLQRLDLSDNQIVSLPSKAFTNLTKLTGLFLTFNKLKCIQADSFEGLDELLVLSLHGNQLSTVPYGTFSHLPRIRNVGLGANPFYCDCNLKWLADWLKAGDKDPGITTCAGPKGMEKKLLTSTASNQFICDSKTHDESILSKCNACYRKPCSNGAKCELLTYDKYKCICAAGFHGDKCEKRIDSCFGQPCMNSATCKALDKGRFQCICPKGFKGGRCETNIDDCEKNKCENGGICVDEINSYACSCPEGWSGRFCTEKRELCTDFNPCKNNAKCKKDSSVKGGYSCYPCPRGWTGRNCSVNVDDCERNLCRNGATCQDLLDGYKCLCAAGFTGQFCERAPLYVDSSIDACSYHDCRNGGVCRKKSFSDYECRCPSGFGGKKCEKLISVSFVEKDSYLKISSNQPLPFNLSLILRTRQPTGVILYSGKGRKHHIAVEVYKGRIRASFNVHEFDLNMYSYDKIDDGKPHALEIRAEKGKLAMSVNKGLTKAVGDSISSTSFSSPLYIGGISDWLNGNVTRWQIKNARSFSGCIEKILLNGDSLNMNDIAGRSGVAPGCSRSEIVGGGERVANPCKSHKCKKGRCIPVGSGMAYKCQCIKGYLGPTCERPPTCAAVEYRAVYKDPRTGCRTKRKVKHRRCEGRCGGSLCCKPRKVKTRRVHMRCRNGRRYIHRMPVIRKCACKKCS